MNNPKSNKYISALNIDKIRDKDYNMHKAGWDLFSALSNFQGDLSAIKFDDNFEATIDGYQHKIYFPNRDDLAARCKTFRKAINLTQKQMAFVVGTTQQTIYQIETAKALPSFIWGLNMVMHFDLNLHWFVTGEASMFTSRDLLEENFNQLKQENKKLKQDLQRKNKMIDIMINNKCDKCYEV